MFSEFILFLIIVYICYMATMNPPADLSEISAMCDLKVHNSRQLTHHMSNIKNGGDFPSIKLPEIVEAAKTCNFKFNSKIKKQVVNQARRDFGDMLCYSSKFLLYNWFHENLRRQNKNCWAMFVETFENKEYLTIVTAELSENLIEQVSYQHFVT